MAKTSEEEEERKQNAPLMNLPVLEEAEAKKTKSKISKRRTFFGDIPVKPRTPQIKIAESRTKLAKPESGDEKNHSAKLKKQSILDVVDEKEEEKELKTRIKKKFDPSKWKCSFNMKNQNGSGKKNTILDDHHDEEEEEEEEKELEIPIAVKIYPPKLQHYFDSKNQGALGKKNTILDDHDEEEEEKELKTQIKQKFDPSKWKCSFNVKNQSGSGQKNTILDDHDEEEEEEEKELEIPITGKMYPPKLQRYFDLKNQGALGKKNTILDDEDDKEEELEKMGSKRRNLDGESRTPQTQITRKSTIGYSIDGKRLPKPRFGYSIDGTKLSKHPQIAEILHMIGDCSNPFEKKLLKTDVDKLAFNRNDVRNGILEHLNKDELAKLRTEGIRVNTYDEFGNRYEMKFESYCNNFFKLCKGWERLYNYHELKECKDCYVDVWMFRHKKNDGICFAVILKR